MASPYPEFMINGRSVGSEHPPFVIAEIGINHEGDETKALRMIDDAAAAGCECVKFQTHVVEDEMIENDVVPGNADEPIYAMMQRCALDAETEARLKMHTESKGMIFLSINLLVSSSFTWAPRCPKTVSRSSRTQCLNSSVSQSSLEFPSMHPKDYRIAYPRG